MQGEKQHKIIQSEHYLLHKRYIIRALYLLTPVEWLGLVLIFPSPEAVILICS